MELEAGIDLELYGYLYMYWHLLFFNCCCLFNYKQNDSLQLILSQYTIGIILHFGGNLLKKMVQIF